MLKNIQDLLKDERVQELIGCTVLPDPDQISQVIENYRTNDQTAIMGYFSEDQLIGLIGYERVTQDEIEIKHIAVESEYRGMGYGRGLILELIEEIQPKIVFAETDDDAVDFYRNIGFEIVSLGEKYPNVERYKCTFMTDY